MTESMPFIFSKFASLEKTEFILVACAYAMAGLLDEDKFEEIQ